MSEKIFVIKIGGSIFMPERDKIDAGYLSGLKKTLVVHINQGLRFVLVVGGGAISRWYMDYAREKLQITENCDITAIGAACTRTNAEVLRSYFGPLAYPSNYCDFSASLDWKEPFLVASAWKPGMSTTMDAVLLAEKFSTQTLIVNSDTEYIYSTDPDLDPSAKPLESLSWDDYETILAKVTDPSRHIPGAHVPVDSIATKKAKSMGLRVIFCKGTDLANLDNILYGRAFRGTVIS